MSNDQFDEHDDDHPTKNELLSATRRIVEQREAKGIGDARRPHAGKKGNEFDWSSQGALVFGGILFSMIALLGVLGVCRNSERSERRMLSEASLIPETVEYGGEKLSGKSFVGMEATRTMKDADLVSAIKEIADAKELPGDVFDDSVPPGKNVASELGKLFKVYKDNPGELERLRAGVAPGEWKISDETLKKAADTLARTEPKRQDIRAMLERKDVCFSFEFIDTAEGKIPNTEAVDFIGDYVLLEEYAVARALEEGKIDSATESLAYIFRIAELAAEVKNPEIRSKAAKIRRHALDITQTVVLDSKFQQKNLVDIYEIFKEQLDHWTSDANAWIGDRASGLKVYNYVIQDGLDAALEENEIAELKERGIYDGYTKQKNLSKVIAKDQVFYLKAMKSIIDSCQLPYYQRRNVLDRVYTDTRRLRGTSDEPIIAEFLLRGITELMNFMALERTEFETAFIAVSFSLNKPLPPNQFVLDPLYGKKYETRQIQNPTEPKIPIVQTSYFECLKPFRVPDYTNGGFAPDSLPKF